MGQALSQVYEVNPAKDGVGLDATRAAATACKRLLEVFLEKVSKFDKSHGVGLDATRAAATACKRLLEVFLEKVSKFDKSLGAWDAEEKRFNGIGRRIKFSLALDTGVTELRATLAGHVSRINVLLLIQTL